VGSGVNFINILRAAFTRTDPKGVKKTVKLSIFFALCISVHAKAARKTLIKSTPALVKALRKHVRKIDPWMGKNAWVIGGAA
jgi:hypothetical protein